MIMTRQVTAFAMRTLLEFTHNTMDLFFIFVWPIMWYFMIVYSLVGPFVPAEVLGYLKACMGFGLGIFGLMTACIIALSCSLVEDVEKERYEKFSTSPVSPIADFIGRTLGAFTIAFSSFVITLLAAVFDKAHFVINNMLYAIGSTVLGVVMSALFCTGIAFLVASFVRRVSTSTIISIMILLLLYLITGYNGVYPRIVPAKIQFLINVIPTSFFTRYALAYLVSIPSIKEYLGPVKLVTDPLHVVMISLLSIFVYAISGIIFIRRLYGSK